MNKKIVTGELKSLSVALLTIGVLLIVVFGSLKTGLIGMIPNISPLIVLGGYMGYLNSPLDMMTMTIMPMLLGIAVDDTIHFINHIKYEFELRGNYEQAILASFKTVWENPGHDDHHPVCNICHVHVFACSKFGPDRLAGIDRLNDCANHRLPDDTDANLVN